MHLMITILPKAFQYKGPYLLLGEMRLDSLGAEGVLVAERRCHALRVVPQVNPKLEEEEAS